MSCHLVYGICKICGKKVYSGRFHFWFRHGIELPMKFKHEKYFKVEKK